MTSRCDWCGPVSAVAVDSCENNNQESNDGGGNSFLSKKKTLPGPSYTKSPQKTKKQTNNKQHKPINVSLLNSLWEGVPVAHAG